MAVAAPSRSTDLEHRHPTPVPFFEKIFISPFVEHSFKLLSLHLEEVEISVKKLFRIVSVKTTNQMYSLDPRNSPTANVDAHILGAPSEAKLNVHQIRVQIVKAGVGLSENVIGDHRRHLLLPQAALFLGHEVVLIGIPILE